jgi:hypothetical protein
MGIAFLPPGTLFQMQRDMRGDTSVVVDPMALGEPGAPVKDPVEIGEGDLAVSDL